ncbi:MAG: hypothetical protein GX096_10910 [Clostridiales bacterium]|nr:hypothetical protein [Clostridiales bacterium]
MAYDMYLGKMLMPVTPSKIQMSINNKNQTVTLINEGEVNLLKSAGLTDVRFTLLIPQVSYPFANYNGKFINASEYLDYFEQLKISKQSFSFIVSRCLPTGKLLFDTNISASLESYSIIEEAKNGFDLNVEIVLKQYRAYSTKTITIEVPSPTAPVIVNETRPIVENPKPTTSSSSSSSSSSSKSSSTKKTTTTTKATKVTSIGAAVGAVVGAVVGAATKGTASAVVKGAAVGAVVGATVSKVASAIKNTVSSTIKKVTSTTKKTTTTVAKKVTPVKKSVASSSKSKVVACLR